MYSKVNYTIVGLFVLLFGAGLVWFAFWLAKYGLQKEYEVYKVEMKESVSGLSKDSNVKLRGVNIGRVSKIRIDPDNIESVEVFLKIKKGVPIKEDMTASTQMMGVTGLLSIEIEGGSNDAKTLVPTDDYIPVIRSKPSTVSRLTNNLEGLGDRLQILLVQSQKLLSNENIESVSKMLDNVEKLTAKGIDVESKAITSLDEVNKTLKQFRIAVANINKKFDKATDNFALMQKDFASIKKVSVPTIDKLMQTSRDFRRVTLKVEKSLDRGDYNLKKILEPMLIEVQILGNQLNSMTRQLEQNPSQILFKSRKQRRGPGE